jgi:four helix bundle protein
MRAQRFEDLAVWQKARELTKCIYGVTCAGEFARDFGLTGQIQRAAVSVMSNIAEGFERGSYKEFLQFLAIAKASCAEVRSQLYIAHDIGYLTQPEFDQLVQLTHEVGRMLGSLRASIAKPDPKL